MDSFSDRTQETATSVPQRMIEMRSPKPSPSLRPMLRPVRDIALRSSTAFDAVGAIG